MTMIEIGHTGAKRTSWSEANPRAVLLKIRRRHPNAVRSESLAYFLEAMEKPVNQKYLRGILECFHTNAFNALVRDETESAARTAEARVAARQKAADIVSGIVVTQAKIILMDLVMPNALALRDCTGNDCRAAGGWLDRVVDLVGDNKVGDVLDETKLRELYAA